MKLFRAHVLICGGAGCISSGCQAVKEAFIQELQANGLQDEIQLIETGCVGSCDLGPIVIVYPEGVFYQHVTPEDVREIVSEHLLKGRYVKRKMYRHPSSGEPVVSSREMDFFRHQTRIALRNVGLIDPENIEEYIARDGYFALGKVLNEMPEELFQEVKNRLAGPRRGGLPTV